MPPKKSQAKEFQEMQEKVAAQARLIAKQEKTICKLQEEQKAREFEAENRIPIPRGQAGRGEGYNLFDEMGVSKETFQALRTVIRHKTSQFLDVSKTIRNQDATRFKHTLFQITKSLPFLSKYYESSWPIRPIMRQYLSSTHRAHEKAVKYLKGAKEVPTHFTAAKGTTLTPKTQPKKNEDKANSGYDEKNKDGVDRESDGDDNTSDEDGDSSDDDDDKVDNGDIGINWVTELAEIERNVRNEASTHDVISNAYSIPSQAKTKNLKTAVATHHAAGKTDQRLAVGKSSQPGAVSKSNKRSAPPRGNTHPHPASDLENDTNKRATNQKADALNRAAEKENIVQNNSTEDSETEPVQLKKGKYPASCGICNGAFPKNPSERVKALCTSLQAALRNPNTPRGKDGQPKGTNFLRGQLCVAIQADIDFQNSFSDADRNHWPAPGAVDFWRVYERILSLNKDEQIWGLLANDIVLRASVAWQSFVAQILDLKYEKIVNNKTVKPSYTLGKFLATSFVKKVNLIDSAFGGYYGPAGEEIILTTLRHEIFSSSQNSLATLWATMADALVAEQESLDHGDFWAGFEPTRFSLEDFMHFVAGPFVTNLLISEDHGISEAEAEVIRLESIDYGKLANPGDNGSIDDLVMIIGAPKRLPSPIDDDLQSDHHFARPEPRVTPSIPAWVADKHVLSSLTTIEDSPATSQKHPRNNDDHEEQGYGERPKKRVKGWTEPSVKAAIEGTALRRSTRHNVSRP